MIVSCPSCGTRYRHDHNPAGRAARCSRCDEVFEFPAQLRSYRVLAAAAPMGAVAGRGGSPRPSELAGVAASLAAAPSSSGDASAGWRSTHRTHREEEAAGADSESGQRAESEPASDHEVWETRESPLAPRVIGVAALLALLWSLGGEGLAVGALAVIAVVTLAWKGWTWASRRP